MTTLALDVDDDASVALAFEKARSEHGAIEWRAKTSDEEWLSLFGGGNREFAAAAKRELGLDLAL